MRKLSLLLFLIPLGAHAQGTIKSLTCPSASITPPVRQTCTVTFSAPVGSLGLTVSLESSSSLMAFITSNRPSPANQSYFWAPPKATSGSFTVTSSGVKTQTKVTLTTFLNPGETSLHTFVVTLNPPGAAHSVTLNWVPPAITPEPIASYEVVRSDGQAFETTETTYVDAAVVAGKSYSYYVESVGANGLLSAASNSETVTIP